MDLSDEALDSRAAARHGTAQDDRATESPRPGHGRVRPKPIEPSLEHSTERSMEHSTEHSTEHLRDEPERRASIGEIEPRGQSAESDGSTEFCDAPSSSPSPSPSSSPSPVPPEAGHAELAGTQTSEVDGPSAMADGSDRSAVADGGLSEARLTSEAVVEWLEGAVHMRTHMPVNTPRVPSCKGALDRAVI